MKKLVFIWVLIAFIIGCNDDFVQEEAVLKSAKVEREEILVKFTLPPSQSPKVEGSLYALRDIGRLKERIGDVYVYEVADKGNALEKLKGRSDIEYAEPNLEVTTNYVSNDPYFVDGSLWGMKAIGADIAWKNGCVGSDDVYIAVVDEGYMYANADLSDNAWINPDEIPGNGIDDDQNGYVDDVYGWDFRNNDNTVFDGRDEFYGLRDSHGTHVAGTIAGKGGNGIGVAGVCWKAKIISGKFLERTGLVSNGVKAIDYIIALKNRGVNIVAINASWGMVSWKGSGYSQTMYDAIKRAGDSGILFVASAGNGAYNLNGQIDSYPACFNLDNIISVGAMDIFGNMAYFSNYGKQVDLFAPGVNIISCYPEYPFYSYLSGTSMAAPHVTGAVALYCSLHPGALPTEVKDAIMNSVVKNKAFQGKCLTGGVLNIAWLAR